MADREIFRSNLNYFLNLYGGKQKDLADYVGAKTTTVSGWTRGVSFPRADSMERIADYFGIPTSKLISKRIEHDYNGEPVDDCVSVPKTEEAKIISAGIDKMSPDRREQALRVLQTIFADYFDGGKDE